MTLLTANREDYILGAAGYSGTLSPWLVYHILNGTQADVVPPVRSMAEHMRECLIKHLGTEYGATVITDEFCTEFTPDFTIEPYLRIDHPGKLQCNSGDLLLIEMVEADTFKYVWKLQYDVIVPWTVKARANIRMKAGGCENAICWVVSDMGKVDEFYGIERDDSLIAKLEAGCNAMVERLQREEEPDPSDDDLNDFIAFNGADSNSVRRVSEKDPIMKTFEAYEVLAADATVAYRLKKSADDASKAAKTELLRELRNSPTIIFPNGKVLSAKTVRCKEKVTAGYQFQKLVITDSTAAAAETE